MVDMRTCISILRRARDMCNVYNYYSGRRQNSGDARRALYTKMDSDNSDGQLGIIYMPHIDNKSSKQLSEKHKRCTEEITDATVVDMNSFEICHSMQPSSNIIYQSRNSMIPVIEDEYTIG